MPTGKTCGNCDSFRRIKTWDGDRNGICETLDYNVHSDSSYAKNCKYYKAKCYSITERRRSKQKILRQKRIQKVLNHADSLDW